MFVAQPVGTVNRVHMILAIAQDEDDRDTRGDTTGAAQKRGVDAFVAHELRHLLAEPVIANAPDHLYRTWALGETCRSDGLVAAFSSRSGVKPGSFRRLTGSRQPGRFYDQVHIQSTKDDYIFQGTLPVYIRIDI